MELLTDAVKEHKIDGKRMTELAGQEGGAAELAELFEGFASFPPLGKFICQMMCAGVLDAFKKDKDAYDKETAQKLKKKKRSASPVDSEPTAKKAHT